MPRKAKPKVDERANRRSEIMATVGEAMKALSAKKPMDWSRENSETLAAGERLDSAMCGFIEGTATREEVKKAYRGYADLHVVEKGIENG